MAYSGRTAQRVEITIGRAGRVRESERAIPRGSGEGVRDRLDVLAGGRHMEDRLRVVWLVHVEVAVTGVDADVERAEVVGNPAGGQVGAGDAAFQAAGRGID